MNRISAAKYSVVGLVLAMLIAFVSVDAFAADQRSTSAAPVKLDATSATAKKPGRVKRVLTLPPSAPRYKCEDGECTCKGVLDCKSLLDSGFCKGKEFWQDGDDPSAGGCG
jgi:hypothetical protein